MFCLRADHVQKGEEQPVCHFFFFFLQFNSVIGKDTDIAWRLLPSVEHGVEWRWQGYWCFKKSSGLHYAEIEDKYRILRVEVGRKNRVKEDLELIFITERTLPLWMTARIIMPLWTCRRNILQFSPRKHARQVSLDFLIKIVLWHTLKGSQDWYL